ncbi:hypothetical protein TUM4445_19090 [Shewanella sp. MBTL60-112-B2]|nr:hypothetical protein TUM4444_15490 [Shewanella sp. MBTL60-112-B1]GIU32862.1 hypothetical protein TUM4445_19090 [Shewanella sp. MBTL60-112-B2]
MLNISNNIGIRTASVREGTLILSLVIWFSLETLQNCIVQENLRKALLSKVASSTGKHLVCIKTNEDLTMNNTSVFKTTTISTLLGLSAMMATGSANADDAPTSLNQDTVSLLQAVALAETNTGGVTIEAEREMKMGQVFYEIELIGKNGKKIYTAINTQTGDVILTGNRSHNDDYDADDKLEDALYLSGLNSGQYLSIEDVVKQAEVQFSAKAWSVELDDDHGNISYEIKLMTVNGKQVETEVNALTTAVSK